MKIVFGLTRFPWPLFTGDRLRAYHQIRVLSQRHAITLVCPPPEDPAHRAHVDSWIETCVFVPSGKREKLFAAAGSLAKGRPGQVGLFCPPALAQAVAEAAPGADVVHLQLSRMGPALGAIRKSAPGTPVVLDFVDSLAMNMRRRAEQDKPPKSWAALTEAKRLERYERVLAVRANAAVAIGQADAEQLRLPAGCVIPNGVDVPSTLPKTSPGQVVAITGNMSYFPNVDAATWFVRHVWPEVRAWMPDAELRLIGADPSPEVLALASPGSVTVTGRVPSMADALREVAVAVAPMRTGSGMQNKVLEAMAMGVPCVVTSLVQRGLGEHLQGYARVADEPKAIAAAVRELLQDPGDLAARAFGQLDRHLRWEATVELLEQVYATVRRGR